MSKKKKNRGKNGNKETNKPNSDPWHKSLKPETKNSLWAVFSFAVAVLFTLAYFGKAGLVGATIQKSLEVTFGKGTIQEPQQINGGAGLHITIARWLTPNGTWVNEGGLIPDVEVSDNPDSEEDEQLQEAIKQLSL